MLESFSNVWTATRYGKFYYSVDNDSGAINRIQNSIMDETGSNVEELS